MFKNSKLQHVFIHTQTFHSLILTCVLPLSVAIAKDLGVLKNKMVLQSLQQSMIEQLQLIFFYSKEKWLDFLGFTNFTAAQCNNKSVLVHKIYSYVKLLLYFSLYHSCFGMAVFNKVYIHL